MSIFKNLQLLSNYEDDNLLDEFTTDSFPNKINLFLYSYDFNRSNSWILPTVRSLEDQIVQDQSLKKEYLDTNGLPLFCNKAMQILLGENNPLIESKKADALQTIGLTGALFVSFQFLSQIMKFTTILIAEPSLGRYEGIAKFSHFPNIIPYRYWDSENFCIDFDGMVEDIQHNDNNAVIVLQMCGNFPTGSDLSKNQWTKLIEIIKMKQLFPVIDASNQGFASGDFNKDSFPIQYFVEQDLELFACHSFSHSFQLYNERVGYLCIITKSARCTSNIKSQINDIIVRTWLNPPCHGSKIVETVLNDKILTNHWFHNVYIYIYIHIFKYCRKNDIKKIANLYSSMRKLLFQKLILLETPGKWKHIMEQKGMYSFTGLTSNQVDYLRTKFHIYTSTSGGINISGLSFSNVGDVAKSIDEAVRNS